MSPILVINVETLPSPRDNHTVWNISRSAGGLRAMYMANLVFLKTESHFRCIKNRWDYNDNDEKIPNFMLGAYINRYAKYFSKKDLITAIIKNNEV